MLSETQEIFNSIELLSIFFILLVAIIIITAVLNYNRKRAHKIEVANYENTLIRSQYEIREQTMQTIGADLHDNIGQLLSLTSFTLKSIAHNEPEVMLKKVHDAIDLTARSIQEMRLLGKLLQGEQLVGLGLHEAIKQEVHWLQKTGVYEVNYTCKGLDNTPGNPEKDLILFRILQEIINNTIKHAQATCINVDLSYDDKLKLTIADNGVGFMMNELSAQQMGMGLQNIQKRASMIGGETTISSLPGNGTTIHVFIPYP
jgi:two-component system NarL family sensor kinase